MSRYHLFNVEPVEPYYYLRHHYLTQSFFSLEMDRERASESSILITSSDTTQTHKCWMEHGRRSEKNPKSALKDRFKLEAGILPQDHHSSRL